MARKREELLIGEERLGEETRGGEEKKITTLALCLPPPATDAKSATALSGWFPLPMSRHGR